jgi:Helix-turn-helix
MHIHVAAVAPHAILYDPLDDSGDSSSVTAKMRRDASRISASGLAPRLSSGVYALAGRAIRRIREEQKINQEEAAERCGLHRTYYSGIERGQG